MANKRYYWLKLQRDFFKRHDIRIIEEMPNGKDYILFYLKLLVESIDHEGQLRFSDTIPYNEQMLSVVTNTNIDIVRTAMKVFGELGMVEVLEDKTIFMQETQKMIGSESESARRVRKFRENQTTPLQCNADVIKSNIEIDIEKDIDTDIEKKKNKKEKIHRHKYGEYENVLLSDEDMKKLKEEFQNDYEDRIERLSSYMASTGKAYKNHLATIRNWARKDRQNTKVEKTDEWDIPDDFFFGGKN